MEVLKVTMKSLTAGFPVPFMQGRQPTLTVPPLSTILGLVSAASGKHIVLGNEVKFLGYRFSYKARGCDLEKVLSYTRDKGVIRNVILKDFLYDCELVLYLPEKFYGSFKSPTFPLVMGRSQDLAYVDKLETVRIVPADRGICRGVLLPVEVLIELELDGLVYNLPTGFDDKPYRSPLKVLPFGIVDREQKLNEIPPAVKNLDFLYREEGEEFIFPLYREDVLKSF